jgi:tetratricopeptide (TPR) repeat protein
VATIALRDYLSGIEELVDQGQTEEALSHCRHVLESHPKHIDTYRLMAKAYLEARRHAEASDIFQRVLSSVPDDFVAHIGMSIVREESGDQDAAIWHMERAFESQPSNRAVQDELRRLYGKREGYAPPKVRLTRGALARMYAHGDLYNQAISELRSALSEDAERPDLQVLMAEMLFRTNRQTDAIDACSKLIEKYPYCLMANRIMAEILVNSDRQIEARPYADRVGELDPYAMHTSGLASPSEVAADSVTVEQLILGSKASGEESLPKAWTGALDMPDGRGRDAKEDLPDWLSIDNFEDGADAPDETQPSETEPTVLGALESLGPKTGSLNPAEATPNEEERKTSDTQPAFISRSPSTALVDDQVPEWLRELRPATSSLNLPSEFHERADDSVAAAPEAGPERPTAPRWTEEFKTAGLDRSQLPAEMEEGAAAESSQPAKAEDESLSWLESLAAESAAKDAAPQKPEREIPPTPSWLAEPETKPTPSASKTDVLAWLDELKTEASTLPVNVEGDTKPQSIESEGSGWEPEIAQTEAEPESSTPSWPVEIPSLENPGATQNTQDERTVPAWLNDLSSEGQQSGGGKTGEISPRQLDEAPDWLSDLRESQPDAAGGEASIEAEAEEETAAQPEESWQPSDDLSKLDWLEEQAPKASRAGSDEFLAESEAETSIVEERSSFETYKPVSDGLSGFELELEEITEAEPEPADSQPITHEAPTYEPEPAAFEPTAFEPAAIETAAFRPEQQEATAEPVVAGARLRTKAAKRSEAHEDAEQRLEQARQALHYNKPEDAATHYGYLLQRRALLDEVVADLSAAVRRSPSDATLWQTLGDAYMRNNQLREALDSYRRAEDLL